MTTKELLKKHFGYDQFRLNQEAVIKAALAGEDTLVIMPTGGGKSICYQIPALMKTGVTIVVSPLIALMKDQVDGLKNNGVAAEYLNSSQTPSEQNRVLKLLRENRLSLCYLAPERIAGENALQNLLGKTKVSLFAIDEAHCISHWGHDFRPDYLSLGLLKAQFPGVPVMALTASADKLTRDDIAKQLKLEHEKRFISSFNRANIWYFVLDKYTMDDFLPSYLDKQKENSGIIYCLSRKSTEQLADELKTIGYKAACYHAGLDKEVREKVQDDFIHDRVKIIVATIAFGMGIDKPDVRFVIHTDLPKNIESYYQETGRAGRDGLRADALLFYSRSDVVKMRYFIDNGSDPDHTSHMLGKLEKMADFAETHKCRRQQLLNYFNEEHTGMCNSCDYCLNKYTVTDATVEAQKALSAVARLNERFGIKTTIDYLRGANLRKFTPQQKEYKTWGIGKDLPEAEWMNIFNQLLLQNLLELSASQYPVLKLNRQSYEVLKGKLNVQMLKDQDSVNQRIPVTGETSENAELLASLRKLRRLIADSEGVPAYMVLGDSSLIGMASLLPLTSDHLSLITGFGDYKIKKYGDAFLGVIRSWCKTQGLESRIHLKMPKTRKSSAPKQLKPKPGLQSLELFKQGKTIRQIADERQLSSVTVEQHLTSFLPSGELTLPELMDVTKVPDILEAIRTHGISSLKTLKVHLGEHFSYFEIKAVVELEKAKITV